VAFEPPSHGNITRTHPKAVLFNRFKGGFADMVIFKISTKETVEITK
jgi:hypothetical protein